MPMLMQWLRIFEETCNSVGIKNLMQGMAGMMSGMGVVWLLVIVVLVLPIAALVKYLFGK
jgi:hypothetical protein